MLGGIISYQSKATKITNTFNLGNITGKSNTGNLIVGGIIGRSSLDAEIEITNSCNTGKVETEKIESKYLGAIVGDLRQIKLKSCYYLKGTFDTGIGGDVSSEEATELDDISKFPKVLEMVNGEGVFKEDVNNINNGYPILEWQ